MHYVNLLLLLFLLLLLLVIMINKNDGNNLLCLYMYVDLAVRGKLVILHWLDWHRQPRVWHQIQVPSSLEYSNSSSSNSAPHCIRLFHHQRLQDQAKSMSLFLLLVLTSLGVVVRTWESWLSGMGSNPSHDSSWLFLRLVNIWQVNYFGM